ncbi:hypothetical protein [Ruminococcus sp.]|uniref:hypothetical protein n=1 Tax=Ruminococcus sp. TaxID=41978 RepID=UPI0025FA4253|nr:hypothetical protein [Ruminococcus sp.]MCR4640353.1 hypothetical protein [Ruminococcus sp.]
MEEFRKKIHRELIVMRILCVLVIASLLIYKILTRDSDSYFSGVLYGVTGAMVALGIGYSVRFNMALKDDVKLKEMYIQQNDERNKQILKESARTSNTIYLFVTAIAAIIAGAFSETVSMTLSIAIVIYSLIEVGVSAYYNKKI